uniref:Secreted protein n=1 Tax=Caenorhabditis japonica TaxID=281687 RepID=A0A8R1ERK7_CAEJA
MSIWLTHSTTHLIMLSTSASHQHTVTHSHRSRHLRLPAHTAIRLHADHDHRNTGSRPLLCALSDLPAGATLSSLSARGTFWNGGHAPPPQHHRGPLYKEA